jgi:hypothetical protein
MATKAAESGAGRLISVWLPVTVIHTRAISTAKDHEKLDRIPMAASGQRT